MGSFFQSHRRFVARAAGEAGRDMFADTRSFTFHDTERGALATRRGRLGTRGVELWEVVSTGHDIALSEPTKVTVLAPSAGTVRVETRAGSRAARPGEALLLGPDTRRTRVEKSSGCLHRGPVLLVPEAAIRREADSPPRSLRNVEATVAGGVDLPTGRTLRSYLHYLYGELGRPDSALAAAGPLDNASALIVNLLGDLTDAIAGVEPLRDHPASLAQVRQAEEVMRARHTEPLSLGDVAASVGIGKRGLQLAFRRHREMSPREALQRIRLDEARFRLATAGSEDTVTSVAFEAGFTHFGRFSLSYRATFGESPSETLRRARRA